jgi:hypothetical protein
MFEILKNYIRLSFDEIKFDFVTWMFYNEINNDSFMGTFHILSILLLS